MDLISAKAIGVDRAGNMIVQCLKRMGVEGIETIASDTDGRYLNFFNADQHVLMKAPMIHGLVSGSYPDIGRLAAEAAADVLRKALGGADIVFVVVGMGRLHGHRSGARRSTGSLGTGSPGHVSGGNAVPVPGGKDKSGGENRHRAV